MPRQPVVTEEPDREELREDALQIELVQAYEACVHVRWTPITSAAAAEFVVEMVIDHADPTSRLKDSKGLRRPPKGALVKRVNMGRDTVAFIQNMPVGQNFLIAVVVAHGQVRDRSRWIEVATLSPTTRDTELGIYDAMNVARAGCKECNCPAYVPLRPSLSNSQDTMRCRHCGCHCTLHTAVEVKEILEKREEKLQKKFGRASKARLPAEALDWDDRECALWFWTDGAVHPRRVLDAFAQRERSAGPSATSGRKGRVSVVTPTTETRQGFHRSLWRTFQAQRWPNKELVVIETYTKDRSEFFEELAKTEPCLRYVCFKRKQGQDWSIGVKRNIGTHIASGEFIANFDDDDLYAPEYLTSMVTRLADQQKQAIKLSSWFIYNQAANKWAFCDPIAWGLSKGLDESTQDVRNWAYGYGFSYVFRRQASLDIWYQDISFGEDYEFIAQMQNLRGAGSCGLFHDDFGICLHVQHGGNTSDSIPLRDVELPEAMNLDIMELAPLFEAPEAGGVASMFATVVADDAKPPSQRLRDVVAHLPSGPWLDVQVRCAVSATAADFLEALQKEIPDVFANTAATLQVLRVAPRGEARESIRDKAAIDVLGLAFLAEMPGAEHNLKPKSHCGQQWRQLLETAKRPMAPRDRIGLRAKELWIRPQAAGTEELHVEDTVEDKFIFVTATLQKTTAKKFFSHVSGSIRIRLPADGSTVAHLRFLMSDQLPGDAKVMEDRPGRGLVLLRDSDALPEAVTLSDFKGQRGFYTSFTLREARIALDMIKAYFLKEEGKKAVVELRKKASGNDIKYSAMLCQVLAVEVYPPILRRFGLPEDKPLQVIMDAMATVLLDKDLVLLWLETELLMKNTVKILGAIYEVNRLNVQLPSHVLALFKPEDKAKLNPEVLAQSSKEQPEEPVLDTPGDEIMATIFAAFDIDQDGSLDFVEMSDALRAAHAESSSLVIPQKDFEAFSGDSWLLNEDQCRALFVKHGVLDSIHEAAERILVRDRRVSSAQQEKLIERNSTLPTNKSKDFTTAEAKAARHEPEHQEQEERPAQQNHEAEKADEQAPTTVGGQRNLTREGPQQTGDAGRFEVVHERVILRANPSVTAIKVGVAIRKNVLLGTPFNVEGHRWLKLDEKTCEEYIFISKTEGTQAWVLFDGYSLGLGELLRPAGDVTVEVVIKHANAKGQVTVDVPESCTMLVVKQALLETLARTARLDNAFPQPEPDPERVKLLRKGAHRFVSCKDAEPLGSMRELLVMGVRFK